MMGTPPTVASTPKRALATLRMYAVTCFVLCRRQNRLNERGRATRKRWAWLPWQRTATPAQESRIPVNELSLGMSRRGTLVSRERSRLKGG